MILKKLRHIFSGHINTPIKQSHGVWKVSETEVRVLTTNPIRGVYPADKGERIGENENEK